ILLRLASSDLLPFKVTAIAEDLQASLREYVEEAGQFLPLGPLVAEVDRLAARLAELEAECAGLTDERTTAAANRLFLRLARTLHPLLYQAGSPFEHDPALASRALPSLAASLRLKAMDPTSDAFKFAVVGLKRRINRITHQVREALREIDLYRAKPSSGAPR